jgi:hypothetical protein
MLLQLWGVDRLLERTGTTGDFSVGGMGASSGAGLPRLLPTKHRRLTPQNEQLDLLANSLRQRRTSLFPHTYDDRGDYFRGFVAKALG